MSLVAISTPLSNDKPPNVTQAVKDHQLRASMFSEFTSQLDNHTCDLVPPSPEYNLVGNKWIFGLSTDLMAISKD